MNLRGLGLLVLTGSFLVASACSDDESPIDSPHAGSSMGAAAGAGGEANLGGEADSADETGGSAGNGGEGGGGVVCKPGSLEDWCNTSYCPNDVQDILDGSCKRSTVSVQKLTCGGKLVSIDDDWGTERWAFDAEGTLTYHFVVTDVVSVCPFELGQRPCAPAPGAAQVLCDGGAGPGVGGAGSGGADALGGGTGGTANAAGAGGAG